MFQVFVMWDNGEIATGEPTADKAVAEAGVKAIEDCMDTIETALNRKILAVGFKKV